ncbi:hypothetical protein, partial [Mycobacterium sp.]|uniref:hypothetical protein n=1 Tax=Mycobacterium sp. TaxID=1785 RepID=UPI003C77C9A6
MIHGGVLALTTPARCSSVPISDIMSSGALHIVSGPFLIEILERLIEAQERAGRKTARAVAEDLGYLAIHPNIAKSELAEALNERFGMGLMLQEIALRKRTFTLVGGVTSDFRSVLYGDELIYLRSDGSILVRANAFEKMAAMNEVAQDSIKQFQNDPSSFQANEGYERDLGVHLEQPTYDGERVHILMTDGKSEVLAPVETLDIEARVFATNWAKSNFTETGNYDGSQFATGETPIADTTVRWVTTDVPGVGPKTMARFEYEFGKRGEQA